MAGWKNFLVSQAAITSKSQAKTLSKGRPQTFHTTRSFVNKKQTNLFTRSTWKKNRGNIDEDFSLLPVKITQGLPLCEKYRNSKLLRLKCEQLAAEQRKNALNVVDGKRQPGFISNKTKQTCQKLYQNIKTSNFQVLA